MRPTEEGSTVLLIADAILNHTDPCQTDSPMLILHAKHRRMSEASTTATDIIHSKQQQKCGICDDIADGWHFNALACGACSAFFRRSVAEQKIYSCVPRTCNVSIHHRRNGIICKYCRFIKCVYAGMRTEEVQGKRSKILGNGEKNKMKAENMGIRIKVEPSNSGSPEQGSSDSHSNSSASNSTHRRRLHPVCIQRNRIGIGSSKCPFLNQVCAKRRLLESRRSSVYQSRSLRMANSADLKFCTNVELDLFSCFLQTFLTDTNTLTSYYDSFTNWLLFEVVLSTLRLGGPQTSQVFLPNMSFFDTFDNAVFNLIHSEMPSHAVSLTHLTMPVVKFFLENVCRPIQHQHFDELEIAALETLLIAKWFLSKSESEELKKRAFDELFLHYVGVERDEGVRFGALVLCLSSIDELKFQVQELSACFRLIGE